MAPDHTSAYFPPLDKCLAGDYRLISWKTAYRSLCDLESASDNTTLEAFLTDPESTSFLSNALDPFLQRGSKTAADFEGKTAAIQVLQAANGEYDLDQLKKDALWLSNQLDVEELIALRCVLLEWQQRAQDQLLLAIVDQNAGGVGVVQSNLRLSTHAGSTSNLGASTNGAHSPVVELATEDARRDRQLQIYLEEKSAILKTSTELVNQIALKNLPINTCKWVFELAQGVTEQQCRTNDATTHEAFCVSLISEVDSKISTFLDPSKCRDIFKSEDAKAIMLEAATWTDITSALRMLLANSFMLEHVATYGTVSSWFKLMAKMSFFQSVVPSPALPSVEPLQSLACIISVAMLDVPGTITRLQESYEAILAGSVQYPQLNGHDAYYLNEECFADVNLVLYNATQESIFIASPVIYAWSIIATYVTDMGNQIRERREQQQDESSDSDLVSRRRASRRDSRNNWSIFEKLSMRLQDLDLEAEARDNPATFFVRVSADITLSIIPKLSEVISSAFGSEIDEATAYFGRMVLLGLIRRGMVLVTYSAEILEAVLSLLAPDVPGRPKRLDSAVVDSFVSDDEIFHPTILDPALARYPFELTPFLKLFTVLAQSQNPEDAGHARLVELLQSMETLTVMVTEDFRDYALEHEDENVNSMVLKEYIPLFASKQALEYGVEGLGRRALTMGSEGEEDSNVLAIPAGAAGFVVKESRPLIFRLEHRHSALEYLGLLFSTLRPSSKFVTAPVEDVLSISTAADIVALATALLKSSLQQHQGIEEARSILEHFAHSLPEGEDFVSVVADTFETEILSHLDQSAQPGSLELLISCVEFLDILMAISPERVWSILARSSLLGLATGANALAAVVSGTEVQIGRFRFLGACTTLFASLIDDAISGLIKRKAKTNKAASRFDSPFSFQDATPERTMTAVLNAYQAVMLDAWQNLGEWRFLVRSEKVDIITKLSLAFERLLNCAYGVANQASVESGISSLLLPAAKSVLDAFTSASANGPALQSFEAVFSSGFSLMDTTLSVNERRVVASQIDAASQALTTALRTKRIVNSEQRHSTKLSSQLLKFTTYLAFLQAVDDSLKCSTSNLLTEVVQTLNESTDSAPPSLLGQLSSETGKNVLAILSQLDRPMNDLRTECAIWNFLSTVMASRQQWLAIYLLTGALPRDRLKDHTSSKGKSLLAFALDQLSAIASVAPELATAILKFVASAQSAWVWATNEIRLHPEFLKNALVWLHTLQPPSRAPNVAEEILSAHEHQMAAYLCDILAVNLHASREIRDSTVLKKVIPRLGFLTQHAGTADAYNRSLHMNLADNFARKFNGCQVADFARTQANPATLGSDYFYDKDLADRILGHEPAWDGSGLNGRWAGFSQEFARANVNLSLVDSQRSLLKSWRVFATMLCEDMTGQPDLQDHLAEAAEQCLSANAAANLDIPGMDEVINIRADMTFVVISKLVGAKAENATMKSLLPAAWDLVRSSPVDFDVATAAEDLRYYRALLQILYLSIQPHVYMTPIRREDSAAQRETGETSPNYLDPNVASAFVEIVAKVIAPGFRALCGNLHNSMELATPADFALLTAILRAVLSVRGIEAVHPQISNIIASTSLIRGAVSLYSWADQLAELMNHDPVYGEVAAMFLLTLSTVRPVAELIAVEGVLAQLSSTNLSNYLRKLGGKGPFDEPKRMFAIWTNAFLPLCLNLLDAVGPGIAGDVAAFLNEFPEQLRRAESSLENVAPSTRNPHAGAITLGLVSEAHSLCVVGVILESDTLKGAAGGINPADVPTLEFDYKKVKDDAAGLMRQKTSLSSRIVAVGPREEAWKVEDGGTDSENMLMGMIVKEIGQLMEAFGDD